MSDREGAGRFSFPRRELRHRTARGVITNAAYLAGAEVLVLAQGLIVAVLLGPAAIGLYGIVSVTAMTIVALRRVGIDEAYVQQSEQGQEREFQRAFTLELGLAGCFTLAIAAAAPLIALVYGEGELLPLTLAVAYLPLAFALQAPTWIFFRRMDFVKQRLLQAIVPVITFCVTVPLAAAGVGVWSLVIGPFVGNAAAALAAIVASPYPLRLRFDRGALRRYAAFSLPSFVVVLTFLVVQQGQLLAFDLADGLAAAGFITLADTLARYADRTDQVVVPTIYPAICAVQGRTKVLEELFLKSNRATLMWALPLSAGFVLFAPDLVAFVLGDKWEPATVLLQGLAVVAGLTAVGFNWFSFYRAHNQPRPPAVESAVVLAGFVGLAVPALFVSGSTAFVAARIATVCAALGVRRHYLRRLLPGVRLARLGLRALAPVALAALAALALRLALWGGERTAVQAAAELVLFVAGTALFTWLLERDLLRELIGYLRAGRLGGEAESVAAEPGRAITA